jgi:hypothetical protein
MVLVLVLVLASSMTVSSALSVYWSRKVFVGAVHHKSPQRLQKLWNYYMYGVKCWGGWFKVWLLFG